MVKETKYEKIDDNNFKKVEIETTALSKVKVQTQIADIAADIEHKSNLIAGLNAEITALDTLKKDLEKLIK